MGLCDPTAGYMRQSTSRAAVVGELDNGGARRHGLARYPASQLDSTVDATLMSGVPTSRQNPVGEPVFRASDELLYREDSRPPDVIFISGFAPRDVRQTELELHVLGARTAFVSTTRDRRLNYVGEKAWDTQIFRYTIDAPGGIDINATMIDHPELKQFHWQQEIAFAGGIRPEYIVGAAPLLPNEHPAAGSQSASAERPPRYGVFIPNPNYDPSRPNVPVEVDSSGRLTDRHLGSDTTGLGDAVAELPKVSKNHAIALAEVSDESQWWRFYTEFDHHTQAKEKLSAREGGLLIDRMPWPYYRANIEYAYQTVLNNLTELRTRFDWEKYQRMFAILTRNSGLNAEVNGVKATRLRRRYRIAATRIPRDLLLESVAGRRIVSQHDLAYFDGQASDFILTSVTPTGEGEMIVDIAYDADAVPEIVQGVFDRYHRDTGQANNEYETLRAIARAIRTLQIMQPFVQGSDQLNIHLLLPAMLLANGFRPVVGQSLPALLRGASTLEVIATSIYEGQHEDSSRLQIGRQVTTGSFAEKASIHRSAHGHYPLTFNDSFPSSQLDPNVDWHQILPVYPSSENPTGAVQYRTDQNRLYREDIRLPWAKEGIPGVFETGFVAQTDRLDLMAHLNGRVTGFVSTTRDRDLRVFTDGDYGRAVYQYEIHAPGGIDINASVGHNWSAQEISFPGGIRRENIVGARRIVANPHGAIYGDADTAPEAATEPTEFIPNPHYQPRALNPSVPSTPFNNIRPYVDDGRGEVIFAPSDGAGAAHQGRIPQLSVGHRRMHETKWASWRVTLEAHEKAWGKMVELRESEAAWLLDSAAKILELDQGSPPYAQTDSASAESEEYERRHRLVIIAVARILRHGGQRGTALSRGQRERLAKEFAARLSSDLYGP